MEILKNLKIHVREIISQETIHILSETIGLEPAGPTVEFEECESSQGAFTIYINAENLRVSDVVILDVYVKPGPETTSVRYLSIPLPVKTERLWALEIPGCSGFTLAFSQPSGRPVSLGVHIWKR